MIWNQKKHSYAASLLPGTRSTAVVTTEPCQLVFCLASAENWASKHRVQRASSRFLQSIRKNYPTGIQPWTGSHWSDSHLTIPPSRSSNMRQRVVWQSDSPMPMRPMGPMCLSPNKRQPSHDPIALIQSLIWNAAMALVNVVELHRPLHVAKNAAKCATSTTSTTSTWWQSWCFRTKGQVSQVFWRKRGSNHGEVRGIANQLDDMLEPRLIAAQALHIQGNNKYAVKWPV